MRGIVLPALFLLLSCGSHALFEDQSGSYDWYQQYVGPVRSAHFSSTKPRVNVGTIPNVIGSLNLRDGSITWRKLLKEKLLDVVIADDLVLSIADGKIRAFDQNSGGQRWEIDIPKASSKPSISVRQHGEFPSISVATLQTIQVRHQPLHAKSSYLHQCLLWLK
jgi:outer membrane protein assembly factor BamB